MKLCASLNDPAKVRQAKAIRLALWAVVTMMCWLQSANLTAASITYVQGNYGVPQSSPTSVAVTFTAAQAAGDLNVVVVSSSDVTSTVSSVTDSSGNSYTLAVGPTTASGYGQQSIYYAKNIAAAGAGANTVTVVYNSAASTPDIRIAEYSGADPSNPVDVTAAATGTNATTSSGAALTSNATDLLFAANRVLTLTTGPGAGYTQRILTSPDGDIVEDEMVTATGSYTATAPLNSAGGWVMQLVAFRTPASGTIPTVTSVSPNTGSTAGGTPVTISGTNFASGATVTFGGTGSATNVTVVNSTTITANAPAGSAGAVTVTVTVGGFSGNLTNGFTYVAPTITYVQGNYAVPHSTTSSVPVTFTSAQTAGDLNVVVVSSHDTTSTVGSVTDTSGNTYALAVGPTVASGYGQQSIYYAKNIVAAGAGANIVTVAFASAATTPDIRILEYSGADPNSPVDVTAGSTGSSATSSSGSVATTYATDLLFGANRVQTLTTGAGSGFTQRLLTSPNGDIAEDRSVTSTGSYSATAPLSSSGSWVMQMVAFRTAPASTLPVVTSVSPSSGAAAGGTPVTISGSNFGAGATVTFGTSAATGVSVVNSTTITATTPSGSAGPVTVKVTLSGQSGSLANGFTYIGTPSVTGVSPSSGSTSGGTAVTITGTNFATGATVTFGTSAATSVVVVSSTSITAKTPSGSSGMVTVTVTNPGALSGSLTNGYTYVVIPTVTGVSPNVGPASGGTAVTITGTNFANGATVTFGTSAATNVMVVNATSITASAPAGTGAVTVTVTVNGQSGSLANAFTYAGTPTITSVSPNSGSSNGGTAVTITGTNFVSGAAVTFGTASATNVAVLSGTSITATTPAGSSGAVTVTVTNPGPQSGGLASAFTYVVPTTITYVQGNYAVPHSTTSSVPVTFTAAQTFGDLNVVVVSQHDTTSTVSSVTDTSGNTYTLAIGPTVASGYGQQSIYYAKSIAAAGAGANTVTVAFASAATTADIRILEYSGADPNNPVDATAGATGTSASSSSGSVTTSNATDLLFGANRVQTTTTGPGSGFTQRLLTSPNGDIAEDELVTSTGSYSATAPLSSSGSWIMQMVAFRTPAGGGSTLPTVTSVSPNNGPTAGGTPVTISGSNFASGATVMFGASAATSVVVVNSVTITAKAPAGSTGAVTVTVMVGGQSASLINGFTYGTVTSTTITYVQGNYATPQSPEASVTTPFTGAQSAGDLNVVAVAWHDNTATVTSVTDNSGNTYTLAVGPTAVSGYGQQSIYYAKNIAPAQAGANIVTVNFSTAATSADIRIVEYSGADANNPVDVTAASTGSSTNSSSGSVTTTNASDLLFGANNVKTITTGPGGSFTQRLLTSPDGDIAEDENVTSTGSYSATAPVSPSGTWIMQMVAFRAMTCTGAPPSTPTSLTATASSAVQINLSWSASASCVGIMNYAVQRCPGTSCTNFQPLGTSTTTTFSDTTAASNSPYTYEVAAVDNNSNTGSYSSPASATTPAISISPRATALTFTRTQQFTSAGSSSVIWSVDGVVGGSSTSGTITTSGLYTPPSSTGNHTVTVSTSNQQYSASSMVYVVNYAGTFTRDVDTMRTGLNPNESVLTPANVNVSTFGKLHSYSIDGVADASPLYVANVNISGQGYHNVVYVATEHDSVYAFDADALQSAPLWHVSFINPSAGVTTVPDTDEGGCNPVCDIQPEIGITSSPVIDPTTNTIYVVAKTKEVSGNNTNYVHRLHALDITTGAEKFSGPEVIAASVAGTGGGSSGGQIAFNSLRENQRPALLLSNGVVYMAFASHGDVTPYHGWVLGYKASNITQQTLAYNTSPDASSYGAGIWMSGDGVATDTTGNLFFVTGNGVFDANTGGPDYGDSLLSINPTTGAVQTYFTPQDQANDNANDLDLGSGGVTLVPSQSGSTAHPNLALTAGKDGTIYLVDRASMGGYNASNNSQIVQSVVNIFPGGTYHTGNFKAPVYWNGNLYYSADADYIKAFSISNAQISTAPTSQSSYVFQYPGTTLEISSNGNSTPILWSIQRVDLDPIGDGTPGPGSLHAFDATNLANELYNSNQAGNARDMLDMTCKWSAPLVANGKVYVASESLLSIFGLLP